MTASRGHPFLRPGFLNSYTGYSIGCFITWAVLLTVLEVTGKRDTLDKVFPFFFGWVAGWTSATLARVIYPPPGHRDSAGATSFFQGFRAN